MESSCQTYPPSYTPSTSCSKETVPRTGHRTVSKLFKRPNKLSETTILVHYDPKLPMRLVGDASNYGVGAVLSHILLDGTEHPVASASQTLKLSERNYAQVK